MSATPRTPLGASTTNRKWYVDVNTGTYDNPTWIGVFGVSDFKDKNDPTLQDDSDFDSDGYKSSTATALEWGAEMKVGRKSTESDQTQYDPGQEVLRAAANKLGVQNRVDVRYYEMEPGGPRVEAWRGFATVSWVPDGGPMDALSTVSVTLTGQGKRTAITHPEADVLPVVYSATPSNLATAGGELVLVKGRNFTGATAVKFGATSVTDFSVIDSSTISVISPALTAGSDEVIVTTAAGTSTGGPQVTYA